MKRIIIAIIAVAVVIGANAQERREQNKPYIDLRPLHFGILVGLNFQDVEFENVGPQTITAEDGTTSQQTILCDDDKWNPGFNVGVVADLRLRDNLSLRFTPTMHFGSKHLTFRNMSQLDENGKPHTETQDMKNTYMSFPIDLKFTAERFNNHRPYIMAGINPMVNLTGKDQDYVKIKKLDTYIEIGIGCDFYLPFFKLIPELKFCYSLTDALDKDHVNDIKDTNLRAYSTSVSSARSKMFVLTFYFE